MSFHLASTRARDGNSNARTKVALTFRYNKSRCREQPAQRTHTPSPELMAWILCRKKRRPTRAEEHHSPKPL